ncbi:MAG: sulfate ABC transporter permease subunit CysT [Deltaproteobacteria bacterium]|nr:sulfate ABC transporter permease subunit CysT [Deltaproteobacteria bacterium]
MRKRSVLPGFGLTLGITVCYVSLVVLLPVSAMVARSTSGGLSGFWAAALSPRALASYRLTLTASLVAASVNAVFGLIVAWVLARYRFPLRRVADALVDLPFALPTAVAGIALTTLYAPTGWIGKPLAAIGIKVAYTPIGITVALTFIGLPFVVRTLQPVIGALDADVEEAAASLGARPWQTFLRVVAPAIIPAWLTGFTLAFARALGEYGSVVFIAGNMPMRTEIAPLLVMTRLEQYDYSGATAIAVLMLGASFVMLLAVNGLQSWSARRSA